MRSRFAHGWVSSGRPATGHTARPDTSALGVGHMGAVAKAWIPVDAEVLGLGQRWIHLACRRMGTTRRFLWWDYLRIWICGIAFLGWQMAQWGISVQHGAYKRGHHDYSSHFQHHRNLQQYNRESSQLERRSRRRSCTTDGSRAGCGSGAACASHRSVRTTSAGHKLSWRHAGFAESRAAKLGRECKTRRIQGARRRGSLSCLRTHGRCERNPSRRESRKECHD